MLLLEITVYSKSVVLSGRVYSKVHLETEFSTAAEQIHLGLV